MATTANEWLLRKIGERLRKYRAQKYESAQQFAFVLGVEPHTYRHWERGDTWPNPEMLVRICRELGITLNDLFPETVQNKNARETA